MRTRLPSVCVGSVLLCFAIALQAQDRTPFTPEDPIVRALQSHQVFVDPNWKGVDLFALRKLAARAVQDRPLRIVVVTQIPASGQQHQTREDYTRALHNYLGLGKGTLIVVTEKGVSATTNSLSGDQIRQILDQTRSEIRTDPTRGIQQTVAALEVSIALQNPQRLPEHPPAPLATITGSRRNGALSSQTGGGNAAPQKAPDASPPLAWIAIPLVLLGAGVTVWAGSRAAVPKKAREQARSPVQRLHGEVVEGITYADIYFDLLPFSVDAVAAREARQAAALLLEQAAGLAHSARTPEDYGRAQALLEQAREQTDLARNHIELATEGTGFAVAVEGTEFKAAPARIQGRPNSVAAPVVSELQVEAIPPAQRGACFFCSRPVRLSDLTPITIALNGRRRKVLACADDVHTVKQGAVPSVRTVFAAGQRVPWYRASSYDPYRNYHEIEVYASPGYTSDRDLRDGLLLDAMLPDLIPMPYPVFVTPDGECTTDPETAYDRGSTDPSRSDSGSASGSSKF
jgi:hypothetical protein